MEQEKSMENDEKSMAIFHVANILKTKKKGMKESMKEASAPSTPYTHSTAYKLTHT